MLDAIAGGTPEASYPLIDALKSPVADVRAQAARALGERAAADRRRAARSHCSRIASRRSGSRRSIALGGSATPTPMPALLPVRGRHGRVPRLSRHARRCGGSTTGRRRPGARLARPQGPRGRAAGHGAGLRRAEPSRALTRFAVSHRAAGRGADQGRRVPGRGPSQGTPVGRQVVGHAAGQRQAAGQDDRLGAGRRGVLAAIRGLAATTRSPRIRIAAVEALAETNDQDSRATLRSPVHRRRRTSRSAAPSPWPSASWPTARRSTS